MDFKNWLHLQEGWGIDPDLFPAEELKKITKAIVDLQGYSNQTKRSALRSNIIDQIVSKDLPFNFSDTDRPEDFIHIEPLNKATHMPVFDGIGVRIPKFEGVNILYGFKFVDYQSHPYVVDAKKQKSDLSKLKGVPPGDFEIIKKAIQEIDYNNNLNLLQKEIKSKFGKSYTIDVIAKVADAPDEMPEIESPAFTAKYMNIIQQAFLKILKHPSTPKAIKFAEHFVELATNNYYRIFPNKYYDYVIYPESSGTLNERIASFLGSLYNAKVIRGFEKTSDKTIDTHNLHQIFGDKADDVIGFDRSRMGKGKMQIKNVRNKDARPFIRMWKKSDEASRKLGVSFKNKHILLIDDNIFSSGTFQAITHVLKKDGPRKIDIYTPLWVDFYH